MDVFEAPKDRSISLTLLTHVALPLGCNLAAGHILALCGQRPRAVHGNLRARGSGDLVSRGPECRLQNACARSVGRNGPRSGCRIQTSRRSGAGAKAVQNTSRGQWMSPTRCVKIAASNRPALGLSQSGGATVVRSRMQEPHASVPSQRVVRDSVSCPPSSGL